MPKKSREVPASDVRWHGDPRRRLRRARPRRALASRPIIGAIAAATARACRSIDLAHGLVLIPGDVRAGRPVHPADRDPAAGRSRSLPIRHQGDPLGQRHVRPRGAARRHGRPAICPTSSMSTDGERLRPADPHVLPAALRIRKALSAKWGGVEPAFEAVHRRGASRRTSVGHRICRSVARGTRKLGERLQVIQGGDFRIYCLYIVAALGRPSRSRRSLGDPPCSQIFPT